MSKKVLFYPIYILIFFSLILWLLDFSFSKKQFTFIKIKSLLSKNTIALIKKEASSIIDFNFDVSKNTEYQLNNRIINFEKFSNTILKYRYYLEQDNKNIYLITNRGELFFFSKKRSFFKKKI